MCAVEVNVVISDCSNDMTAATVTSALDLCVWRHRRLPLAALDSRPPFPGRELPAAMEWFVIQRNFFFVVTGTDAAVSSSFSRKVAPYYICGCRCYTWYLRIKIIEKKQNLYDFSCAQAEIVLRQRMHQLAWQVSQLTRLHPCSHVDLNFNKSQHVIYSWCVG